MSGIPGTSQRTMICTVTHGILPVHNGIGIFVRLIKHAFLGKLPSASPLRSYLFRSEGIRYLSRLRWLRHHDPLTSICASAMLGLESGTYISHDSVARLIETKACTAHAIVAVICGRMPTTWHVHETPSIACGVVWHYFQVVQCVRVPVLGRYK